MTDISRIEKHSLEAHVELCARRYGSLEDRLDNVTTKLDKLETVVDQVFELVSSTERSRQDRLISWGVGIIASLTGVIGWLVTNYILK